MGSQAATGAISFVRQLDGPLVKGHDLGREAYCTRGPRGMAPLTPSGSTSSVLV